MDFVNLPNGFRPTGADFLKREQNKAAEFARLREQLGRGVAKGLHLTRQSSDGSVVLSAGHGADGNGNAIVVLRAATLDLSGATKPQTGKFRWVAVTLKYKQTEKGTAAGVSGAWAEKTDGYEVVLIGGVEANTKDAAAKPANATQALRVGDILFDDNGTRLAETSLADKPAWKTYADQKATKAEQDAIAEAQKDAAKKDGALDTKLQTKIAADILAAKKALFPVGSVYINVKNTANPGTLLGFGTWKLLPHGYYLAQAGGSYSIGLKYPDGLPNIYGHVAIGGTTGTDWNLVSGPFEPMPNDGSNPGLYSDHSFTRWHRAGVRFNAHRANNIYGKVNHVQPKTFGACMWQRIK